MSAGFAPYFLRLNKAIDRELFVELLQKLDGQVAISEYRYVGLGGPFLEDFRRLHVALGLRNMISVESHPQVFVRQKINRPLSCISCLEKSSADFLEEDSYDGKSIVWLDYSDPSRLGDQIAEFRMALQGSKVGDILRITLNADLGSLAGADRLLPNGETLPEKRLSVLRSRIGRLVPDAVSLGDMVPLRFPEILLKCLQRVIEEEHVSFLPLLATTYKDTQRMFTLAGIRTENEASGSELAGGSGIKNWAFYLGAQSEVVNIDVPILSMKERVRIDESLPDAEETDVPLHSDPATSRDFMTNYRRFYRYYPQFSRVVL